MLETHELQAIKSLYSEVLRARKKLDSPGSDYMHSCTPLRIQTRYWTAELSLNGITPSVRSQLYIWSQSRQVHKWMRALQQGQPVAGMPSAAKIVGHTLCRFHAHSRLAKSTFTKAEELSTYAKILECRNAQNDQRGEEALTQEGSAIAQRARHELNRLYRWSAQCKSELLIVIGMGGSSLGTEALQSALQRHHKVLTALMDQGGEGTTGCDEPARKRSVLYITSTDTCQIEHLKSRVGEIRSRGGRVSLAAISKSGSTFEVQWNLEEIAKRGIVVDEKITVTTEGSLLDSNRLFDERFYMDSSVGGRFSVTSCVGALVISYMFGSEIFERFLHGAASMDQHSCSDEKWGNLPLALALVRLYNCNFRDLIGVSIAPYIPQLEPLIGHLQQVEMESNGKSVDRLGRSLKPVDAPVDILDELSPKHECSKDGGDDAIDAKVQAFSQLPPLHLKSPLIWGAQAPQCQHAFFQWLHQGPLKSSIEFIVEIDGGGRANELEAYREESESNSLQQSLHDEPLVDGCDESLASKEPQIALLAAALGQSLALSRGKYSSDPAKSFRGERPVTLLWCETLTPEAIGALFALYEHVSIFEGFLLGVNSFDQEGVELGKELTRKVHAKMIQQNPCSFSQILDEMLAAKPE